MAKHTRLLRGETLELYAHEQSAPDRLREIEQLLDNLTAEELRTVRALAGARRRAKLEEAKALLLQEMEGRAKALGLTMKDVFPLHTPGTKRRAPVKYRCPSGQTWSGRGRAPTWLRALEAEGHTREEFRVIEGDHKPGP